MWFVENSFFNITFTALFNITFSIAILQEKLLLLSDDILVGWGLVGCMVSLYQQLTFLLPSILVEVFHVVLLSAHVFFVLINFKVVIVSHCVQYIDV